MGGSAEGGERLANTAKYPVSGTFVGVQGVITQGFLMDIRC